MRERTSKGHRSALRMWEAAMELFGERGYEATTMREISKHSGFSLGALYRHYPTKEAFALTLYERLTTDLEDALSSLPQETIALRFEALVQAKMSLLEPHRTALKSLFVHSFDMGEREGLSSWTVRIRARMLAIFRVVLRGAKDKPKEEDVGIWSRFLYGLHLGLIFVWVQDLDEGKTLDQSVSLAAQMVKMTPLVTIFPQGMSFFKGLDHLFGRLLHTTSIKEPEDAAKQVLSCILRRGCILPSHDGKESHIAPIDLHLSKIQQFIDEQQPIELALQAFPAKIANAQKVLGKQPDRGEWLSLQALDALCEEIATYYPQGARIILCPDGHVIGDLVHLDDEDVDDYLSSLVEMLQRLETSFEIFQMRDAFGDIALKEARQKLLQTYARTLEEIEEEAQDSATFAAQVDGIYRLLCEDEWARCPKESHPQLLKRVRPLANQVAQRTEAWGRLASMCFPQALRLSPQPQPKHAPKLGISLLEAEEIWSTAWNSVVVERGGKPRLMKRAEAEILGGVLIKEDGRPWWIELPSEA
ncbi:MAG: L-tyrosine/L-tryptophan isonitrile synthase family protein [Myxococcales bacterium]|nr:L-tyrosine/L-tryptophan isonitrile synthase family protein [Myxococcales bacterium]